MSAAGSRVTCFLNQKGGVGKTTSSVNVAHALARAGRDVVGIDLDPQGHFAASLGLEGLDPGLDDVLFDQVPLAERLQPARERVRLVPPGPRLPEVEQMVGGRERGWLLQRAVAGLDPFPDYVVIDCPPSSGLLAINALLATDEVVMPVSCDYLALEGLAGLMRTLMRVERGLGIHTRKYVLVTRYNGQRRLPKEVLGKLKEYFPGQVLKTAVRDNVALAEAPGFGQTIFEYRPESNGAKDYRALAEDLEQHRVFEPAAEA
ncbi:MAG: ParA family protein [Halorhodospira halophila]|uniref:ParA family protein n=1 Tax=Halorhodospira TaxID=85108 RepID=UPI001EE8B525|nr:MULTISPECIES: ParA family protein [Halorhodospira]MCC3750601.1 ParA family protein [Halorhodospira halophila]MCG5527405.1 ParA family protein [Halorhodospira halophila]MCG5532875.1 ParA family protein [Halorhodospira sp. 9621]MCG5538483.1 ParA family protein [Halorhodospira sp. 9622]MCG5543601.1 ParA family protein [Halorhodospira sp. 9628]